MISFDYQMNQSKTQKEKINMSSSEQAITRNAIFYSSNNVALYNELRRYCNAEKINIILANNLGTLDNVIHSTDFSILFIDANTKNLDTDLLDFISYSEKVSRNLSVIIDGDRRIEDIAPTIFAMSSKEVIHKIPDIKRSVKLLEGANIQTITQNVKEVRESDVFELLMDQGFDMKLEGFMYMVSIIRLFLTNGKVASPLSKSAYPMVASSFGTKPENVERNIRNAIKQASKTEKFQQGLGCVLTSNPSNMQVINYFVASLKNRYM